jgi:hypothetical protein
MPTNSSERSAADFPAAETPSEALEAACRAVVHAATRAPSVHNSQPWRFTRDATGLDLFAEETRRLPVLDPYGRQVHLSCGAALLHARVAARAVGFDAVVTLLPVASDAGHLARLELTAGAAGTAAEHALAGAVEHRHTYRDAFQERPLPVSLVDELRAAVEAEGAWLAVLDDPDDVLELEVLLAWADGLEEADPAYRAELAASLRTRPSPVGIPSAVLPPDAQRGSSLRLRDFAGTGAPASRDEPPVAERPVVVIVLSDDDSPRSWLQAGQAVGALLLHAAAVGVMGQPLGQVTDFDAGRLRLRSALGLTGVPQLALRLGFPQAGEAGAATGRLEVDDVLAAGSHG